MKILEKSQIQKLLQLIQIKQDQHIMHFSSGSHLLTKNLSALCKQKKSHYHLYCNKNVFYDKSVTKYKKESHLHIFKFSFTQTNYIRGHIAYDYLIVTLDFSEESKTAFLQKCYPVIKTGGSIILIVPNSNDAERKEWRALLKEPYYLSPNIIDTIFESYDIIVSTRIK